MCLTCCRNTHDAYHIVDQEEMVCSAITYPSSTSEVQSIVRWANEFKIPIYPVSVGRNLGYGGASPRVPGSVVIDLGRKMKYSRLMGKMRAVWLSPGLAISSFMKRFKRQGSSSGLTRQIWVVEVYWEMQLIEGLGMFLPCLGTPRVTKSLDTHLMVTTLPTTAEWRSCSQTAAFSELEWERSLEKTEQTTQRGSPSNMHTGQQSTEYSAKAISAS